MEDINDLKDDRIHLLKSNDDILKRAEAQGRAANDEEMREISQNISDAEALEKKIKEIERHNELKRSVAASLESKPATSPIPRMSTQSQDSEPVIEFVRSGSMKAFKPGQEREAFKAGKWIRANFFGDKRAAQWCKEHGVTQAIEAKAQSLRAHSEGVNTAGGVLVPEQFEQTVIDLREKYGVFRQNTKVYSMGSDTMSMSRRASGLTAYFVDEAAQGTESTKSWNRVSLVAKKLMTYSLWSSELDEDAYISIADDLAQESAYAFALKEDQCGFTGDGTSTYAGITGVNYLLESTSPQLAGAVDAGSGIDSLGEVTATVLAKLIAKLPQYAQASAKFYCSQAAFALIFERLAVSAGGNTMSIINGSFSPAYLGHPIVISQTLFADSGATAGNNKIMLMYGDLALASSMGDRRGIRYAISTDHKFLEDQIAIKATERFDINVHDVGDATNAGPIVGLMGET